MVALASLCLGCPSRTTSSKPVKHDKEKKMLLLHEAEGAENGHPAKPSSEIREPEEHGLAGHSRPGEHGNKPGEEPESADSRP
ncbi:MAG: hypothetical protein ACPG77_21315 [Nannocystaceae bacterium]